MKRIAVTCICVLVIVQLALPTCGTSSPGDTLPPLAQKGPGETPLLLAERDIGAVIGDLDAAIPLLMEKAGIPGFQIALIRDGTVVWERGYGVKNSGTGEPVTRRQPRSPSFFTAQPRSAA